jgi:hypothetical protein
MKVFFNGFSNLREKLVTTYVATVGVMAYIESAYAQIFLSGQQPLVPFLLLGHLFSPIILFLSPPLLTRITGSSLHMQWPLTSQSHSSFLKENNWVFIMYQTTRPYLTRSLPTQF